MLWGGKSCNYFFFDIRRKSTIKYIAIVVWWELFVVNSEFKGKLGFFPYSNFYISQYIP